MKHAFPFLAISLFAAAWLLAAEPAETPSAFEQNPDGWTDLLFGEKTARWKRQPIPGGTLGEKNPWQRDSEAKVLVCNGVGIKERLMYGQELADGVLHVEWRFRPIKGKKGYNSGVFVRTSEDGTVMHQAQLGDRNVGFLFGDVPVDGKIGRVKLEFLGAQRGKPPGEWNTFEITCRGKTLSLWTNGAVTCTWDDCALEKGYIGLESEGWVVEFRNVLLKAL